MTRARDLASGSGIEAGEVVPHIIPDKLYPAWSGLLTENTAYTFTDSSDDARVITPTGNVHHSGRTSKVGGTSILFEANGDSISVPDHADFDNGTTGEFTLEFWFNLNKIPGYQYFVNWNDSILRMSYDSGNNYWYLNAAGNSNTSYTTPPTVGTWTHCAIVGTSSTVKVYLGGVERISVARHGSTALNPTQFILGGYSATAAAMCGLMDEIRYSKLAVYTGTFTPQTTALTTTWSAGTNIAANSTASNVKLLIHSDNGGHVGAYGTTQADGRSYYYTDIKGSKPIKDPRIGAHFGSQRYKFSSIQTLEQETATHGQTIYSIDGREWCRMSWGQPDNNKMYYNNHGNYIQFDTGHSDNTDWIEVIGYFSSLNILCNTDNNQENFNVTLNGTPNSSVNALAVTVTSPLFGRYVSASSVCNVVFDSAPTLGIHTVKIGNDDGYMGISGIELITQDTSNVNNIQIPSQNVVSYGKKFTVSGTPHYNPFAFAGDGTTAVAIGDTTSHGKVADGWTGSTATYFDSTLDTATSLGLSAWETGGDFYRPINGGRVVKWVDSSGNIKTSVNMMPPCATAITAGTDASLPTSHAWTTVYQPKIKSGAIDHSLSEVAKTFHWREFGNGAANEGNNTSGTLQDASMLNAEDDIAYVMDDGLTSLYGDNVSFGSTHGFWISGSPGYQYITFIGTGITWGSGGQGINTIVQNLPYGTHIIQIYHSDNGEGSWKIDGVTVKNDFSSSGGNNYVYNWGIAGDITFHQPKKPPIPEDAVVLADYMLMADFVKQGDAEITQISKGVRALSGSRDIFADDTGSRAFLSDTFDSVILDTAQIPFGMTPFASHSSTQTSFAQLPFFGTHAMVMCQSSDVAHLIDFGPAGNMSSSVAWTALDCSTNNACDVLSINSSVTLGMNEVKTKLLNGGYSFQGYQLASPTHTSSHYQTFETPFLHELVGGDRNMEQHNLIVTPDGKTWDEVTRDTSYLGKKVLHAGYYLGNGSVNPLIIDEWRGFADYKNRFNKDWAIAYDRLICLVDGQYKIAFHAYSHTTGMYFYCNKNAVTTSGNNYDMLMYALMTAQDTTIDTNVTEYFVRGDWIQFGASAGNLDGDGRTWFEIERI